MINGLILSKNRSSQLRLLLESINLNAPYLFNEIKIIYTSSNEDFAKGYEKLKSERILSNLVWEKEENFVQDFLNALKTCETDYICGIVDDCIFYKRLASKPQAIIDVLTDDVFCFSFRLGLNTTTQYYMRPQEKFELKAYDQSGMFVRWNWKEWDSKLNYGYPISLDGHVFRTKELSDLSHKFKFDYLRQWEGVIAGKCREETDRHNMASYKQNVLFSIPSNCVQDPPLVAGQLHEYSEEKLNNLYLKGEVIDLEMMEYAFQNVTWAHNEFPLMFKQL
tara:strand:+ start:381 stop:1217 length:837 start_codon:yes stop_codon:yes gene_type:complete